MNDAVSDLRWFGPSARTDGDMLPARWVSQIINIAQEKPAIPHNSERLLWASVVAQTIAEAVGYCSFGYDSFDARQRDARACIAGEDFHTIAELAGLPDHFAQAFRRLLSTLGDQALRAIGYEMSHFKAGDTHNNWRAS